MRRECLVMAKPAGPRCNLRCTYCYYVGKTELLPADGGLPMDEELLERYIAGRFAASPGPTTHFEWHGGEPTLLGLDYFETIVRLQRRHLPQGRTVGNGLQTNGTLIDARWARFLAREGFSVGLSMDGPADLHDRYRVGPGGEPSHERAERAFRLLRDQAVFLNILCVVSRANVGEPDRVYDYFRELGATHLQFLPLAGRAAVGGVTEETAGPEAIGAFLCRIFDRWIERDVGRVVIQTFDEALRPIHGVAHALCVHRETCGDVAVLERDGGFYACDHFVDGEHRLGSLRERALSELAADPRMEAFGLAKRDRLPRLCRSCGQLAFCNGGCPKDRFLTTPDGEPGLNYLCAAYRQLFSHVAPELQRLSAHMKAGKRLREFRPSPASVPGPGAARRDQETGPRSGS
ncbi:MAG TPA: anaerobic sulfatase maturase [Rectinemataceae bacterium]|nr:anaerobic sulfatase maturase [Rectinemataceae bacterium]